MIEVHLAWLLLGLAFLALAPFVGGQLFLVDLAVAAFIVAFVTSIQPDLALLHQWLLFMAATLAFLPTIYGLVFRLTRHRRDPGVAPASEYRGREAVVVRRGAGLGVRIDGEVLPLRTEGEPPSPGEVVTIERVEGITARIRRRDERSVPLEADRD